MPLPVRDAKIAAKAVEHVVEHVVEQAEDRLEEIVVEIADHLKPDVQRLGFLIQHYQQMANQYHAELARLLHVAHGINITEPGWRVDSEGGVAARIPQQVPAPHPVDGN